ncbi:MAG TPA: hypothetical protein VHW24_20995 [Bryobacteraceae bacterium]|nr:hypothetical protein [Bryobacteraceae bacterium]
MRLRAKLGLAGSAMLLAAGAASAAELPYYNVLARDAGAWPQIMESVGFEKDASAHLVIARAGTPAAGDWLARVDKGTILVLEGESPLAESFGFKRGKGTVRTTDLRDVHRPDLPIIWQKPLELPLMDLPAGAQVFTRERWTNAPMTAGLRRGSGAVLWIATAPGERGYERFPYILAALTDLGMEAPFRGSRLWAFFDSSYRSRVDLDYFAARWRKSGVAALHVAAWHFYERDPERDEYLRKLIEACHREGILVYAWLELPHVSEKFWDEHPEWREKTAVQQDAQLDWRKLMNLTNRDCFRAVSAGVKDLISNFGWDGVNLAELYFESLEGIGNPSRFTPMNADVRAEFKARAGFDPMELFSSRKDDAAARKEFLDYRADLARRMQQEWLAELEGLRAKKPDLDLVLTHVDDRFDSGMREAIGADAARVLPMLDTHAFTFLIEDPATVWNLGAQRYQAIAEKYRPLTTHREKLAVDINIVDRYQDVYPTTQQTGAELFELVHSAAANFSRVALYFENSLLTPDLPLLPSSSAAVKHITRAGGKLSIETASGVGLPWKGAAMVDGRLWPASDDSTVWLPAGNHTVEETSNAAPARLLQLNGELKNAHVAGSGIEFTYTSAAHAIATFDRVPRTASVDGHAIALELAGPASLMLPRGEHVVTIRFD